MRSGWKTLTPTSIDDRDDALNNVLFETCISNWAKMDFPKDNYQEIKAELLQIDLSKAYYDLELRPRELAEGPAREQIDTGGTIVKYKTITNQSRTEFKPITNEV
ncbi:hypothetical protein LTS08_000311 [Lithohypha guttulata]|uniref:Uncharacterized protein n=1 Tax=Lithohypha guttulata TaxID=1690604 RepID=A0AAN7Y9Y2_9EURO|nr:hypothetical protein LTR51_007067 [Lithohypha guttulata]KAK5084254.1 hypothetical protein LTR05_005330 [Lithohypha guttulata]KAK5106194.1 hypothetical protein LTS08_000311 [Lithohypha guttulata]